MILRAGSKAELYPRIFPILWNIIRVVSFTGWLKWKGRERCRKENMEFVACVGYVVAENITVLKLYFVDNVTLLV